MESLFNLIIYFAICAFMGWVIQAIVDLIGTRKITNTGYLYGPFIPIYGFTALLIYFFNLYFINFPLLFRLIFYFLLPTVIEYLTGFSLEKTFHVRLWNYSNYRFNIRGRVSLTVSTFWFLLVLLQVFVLQDILLNVINQFSEITRVIFGVGLIIYFTIDLSLSTKVFYYFSKVREELEKVEDKIDLKKLNKELASKINFISQKIRISPVLRSNLKKDAREFIERFGKK